MNKNCVIELCITNANDKDGISVYIDVPVKEKTSFDKLAKMLAPKENDKFCVVAGSINLFKINTLQYFKKRSTIDEILVKIEKLENDILAVINSDKQETFEYIEDDIDIRAVSEELVNINENRNYIKDLFIYYNEYDFNNVYDFDDEYNSNDLEPLEIAIDLMDNEQLVNFIVKCVDSGITKAYSVLDMLISITTENSYEYIASLIKHLPLYNFQNLKCIHEKK